MNDRTLFSKVSILSEFLIFQSNLFHSTMGSGIPELENWVKKPSYALWRN